MNVIISSEMKSRSCQVKRILWSGYELFKKLARVSPRVFTPDKNDFEFFERLENL